jgi:hypothetical protein
VSAHDRPPARVAGAEQARLAESPRDTDPWREWGPYLAGRQWGTVREDYSADGDAWGYFPFDQAHVRAYRWGEDGLGGLCDRFGFLNLSVALWNGADDRLKERCFGLTNAQGNHGEDAKEHWWHLDATPTHSYAEWLYRYPQAAYPYEQLVAVNASRSRTEPEFELADTGILAQDRFFDIHVAHAKASPQDICVRITATNHGPDPAPLDLLPQLWFRNTWRWGRDDRVPVLRQVDPPERDAEGLRAVEATHGFLGRYHLLAQGAPDLLFCDNETNAMSLFGAAANPTPFPKDAVNRAVVHGDTSVLNPAHHGTKVGVRYHFDAVAPGQSVTVALRLLAGPVPDRAFGAGFDAVFADRLDEADQFYAGIIPTHVSDADRVVARRAFAGLLWGRQVYRYSVSEWLEGDPGEPPPPAARRRREPLGRNTSWRHLALADVISMPDEWEYPWFASWDLAFHCVTLAHIDPSFAKNQLMLMCREWAQHPNGQIPAYEWSFSDVNPPVHAWAAWQVFALDGGWDHDFLVRIFGKLLVNFAWWVNRKDADGSDLFEGGFLGMDNIGLFDRSRQVPPGWRLVQSDATSWMAFYALSMLRIALELARADAAWDDLATTFLERFLTIAEAMESPASGVSLWNDDDGFYYDALVAYDDTALDNGMGVEQLPVRSLVGLLPLLAVALAPEWVSVELPDFTQRLRWLQRHRPEQTAALITSLDESTHQTLALVDPQRYARLVARLLDEQEFLSPHGVRSLSAAYRNGFTAQVDGAAMTTRYDPGESTSALFGGNSNWRGPVWFPVNVLLADALRTYADGAGRDLRVELPTGSGNRVPLPVVADELEQRLIGLFRPGPDGRRPGDPRDHGDGPLWQPHPTFSEYFHGDTGAGLGASHQTGWTALVAHLICTTVPAVPAPRTP